MVKQTKLSEGFVSSVLKY